MDGSAESGVTWPTPSASLGGHGGLVSEAKGREGGTLIEAVSARMMFPTPAAAAYGSNQGGAGERTGPVRHSLDSMAARGAWPTPCAADSRGSSGQPGPRKQVQLVDAVRMWPTPHGMGEDGHGNELSQAMRVANGDSASERSAAKVGSYAIEPWERGIPRVVPRGAPNRTNRLKTLGNAVVPAVVEAIGRAVKRADEEMSKP